MQLRELCACPICSGELVPLGISEHYDLKALGERVSIDFAMCGACTFVCQSRVLPLDALMRYYQDSPKLREAVPSDTDAGLYAAQAAFMERAGELHGKRVLDIGADMGKLLDHLAHAYRAQTYYQEENATARAWLQDNGRHKEAANLADHGPYDWIVLSQVLEHIIEPVPMLVDLRRHLGSAGKLFLEVPNHGFWDDLDVGFFFEHVNYFSPASLTAALDRAGYHLLNLEVTTDPHYFEGRCRIVRACAQPRPAAVAADPAAAVRAHEHRHKTARFLAIDALSREVMRPGKPGLAIYGAAELADLLFRETGANAGRIAAVFDSDMRKHGLQFGGLPVRPPSEIVEVDPAAIVILSSAEADIRRTIESSGFRGRVIPWSEIA